MKRFLPLLLLLALSACNVLSLLSPSATPSAASGTPLASPTGPGPLPTSQTPTLPPTPANPTELTLWLPPQFDPSGNSAAAQLLAQRLQQFSQQQRGWTVTVRIKPAQGSGGLLDALSTTSAVARPALPSLVVLRYGDMESAALKGLIQPLQNLSDAAAAADWYDYARQMAQVQGTNYCLPLAGDALTLVYRTDQLVVRNGTWDEVLSQGRKVLFAANDVSNLLTLDLYLSAGGQLQDQQGRPLLQADALSRVLSLYAGGGRNGVFATSLGNLADNTQVWQSFTQGQDAGALVWSSSYLAAPPAGMNATVPPNLGNKPFTLADSWLICLSEPYAQRRDQSARLAEFLVDPQFLAGWTEASGTLPPRPSALSAWKNQTLRDLAGQLSLAANPVPPNEILSGVGPVLRDAAIAVVVQHNDPQQAAQKAVTTLLGGAGGSGAP